MILDEATNLGTRADRLVILDLTLSSLTANIRIWLSTGVLAFEPDTSLKTDYIITM